MASTTDRLLISQEDFFEYETITANTDPQKILPYIREAQKFDLTSVLNTELIEDLQDNPELARNAALMQYVRPVLCYYSYGRYVRMRNVTDTDYGMVTKTNEFSQPASEKTIARVATEVANLASAYARILLKFLYDNATTYTLWEQNCAAQNSPIRTGYKIDDVSLR
jgi:hypothetical protein